MTTPAAHALATAAEALYAGSLKEFTAERKRLADDVRKGGDRATAALIAKLPRPSMSAWLVNRLWREARAEVDALFAAAAQVQGGDLGAMAAQRAVLTRLRAQGAALLVADGHAAAEGTLARAATTLQALAAIGGFDPDPPGQLITDRDPPGFEAMAAMAGAAAVTRVAAAAPPAAVAVASAAAPDGDAVDAVDAARAAERVAAAMAAAAQAEAERLAAAAARARAVERRRQIAELANLERLAEQAARDAEVRAKTAVELRGALARAETALTDAQAKADAAARAAAHARARLEAESDDELDDGPPDRAR